MSHYEERLDRDLTRIKQHLAILAPVSYTHLDVYKRQTFNCLATLLRVLSL